MRLMFDFTAQEGRHLGPVTPIDDLVAAIPDAIDVWTPAATFLTQAAGRVTTWSGRRNGRTLVQATTPRQPTLEGRRLRMMSETFLSTASLDLAGTAIGVRTSLTIAISATVHPSALDTDLHYISGAAAPVNRLSYRYTNGIRYLRYQVGSQNLDVPLPSGFTGAIGCVLVLSGATLTLYLSTGGTAAITLTGPFELATFTVGQAQANQVGDLPGWIGNVGIWTRAVSVAERELLLRWVG